MKTIIMFLYVKLGFSRLNPGEKVSKALSIVAALTGNANFPVTDPDKGDVEDAANDLQTAINAAKTGDREMIAVRNEKEATLDELIGTLQSDINTKSKGDPIKILSAGMEVVSPRSPVGLLGPVTGLTATTVPIPGLVDLKWTGINKTLVYVVQATNDGQLNNWELVGESTKTSYSIPNRMSGQICFFRIACITSAGLGPWSEAVSCRVL